MLEKIFLLTVFTLLEASFIKDLQTEDLIVHVKMGNALAARIDIAGYICVHITILSVIQFSDLVEQLADQAAVVFDRFLKSCDLILFRIK